MKPYLSSARLSRARATATRLAAIFVVLMAACSPASDPLSSVVLETPAGTENPLPNPTLNPVETLPGAPPAAETAVPGEDQPAREMPQPGRKPTAGEGRISRDPTSGPEPYLQFSLAWDRVEIPQAGLSLEVPQGWAEVDGAWAWIPPEGAARLGLTWADPQPGQEVEAMLLPPAEVKITGPEPAETAAGPGRSYRWEVPGQGGEIQATETHVLFTGTNGRVFDVYIAGRTAIEMDSLRIILQHALDTVVLTD